MAEIVDAFVATLGLDDREYRKSVRAYRDDRKRLAEEEQKQNRISQDGQSRTIAGLRTLRNETAGFLLMLAGATSVLGFAKDLMTADAATGRFARNTGMATERVSVWENALKRVGGTAEEARAALGTLFGIFQNYQLMGDLSKGGALAFFGLSERDLKDPEAALLRIAEVVKNMPREDVEARLATLGLSGSIVGLLAGDRGELTKLLASVEAAGVANDESADAAMNLEAKMAEIAQTIQGAARPALTDLTNAFIRLTDIINGLIESKGMQMLNDIFGSGSVADVRPADPGGAGIPNVFDAIGDAFPENKGAQLLKKRWGTARPPGDGPSNWSVRGGDSRSVGEIFGRTGGGIGARNPATVERYFRNKGFSAAQARGIAASIVAEGGLARRTGGGYKGRALGIGQLLGPRRAEFLRRYGPNFTLQNELDFFYEEMNNASGRYVANRIKQSGDSGAVARIMIDQHFRPAPGRETLGDYQRASRYLKQPVGGGSPRSVSQSNVTTVGQINVYTPAANAPGIARDIRGEMAKRGLVVQAGNGLRP